MSNLRDPMLCPFQVLYEKGTLSTKTQQILKNLNGALLDSLIPNKEFWSAEKTLKFLAEGNYFGEVEGAVQTSSGTGYPEVVRNMLDEGPLGFCLAISTCILFNSIILKD